MTTNDRQTVLVTGAGTGIGRATALAFAETGARVAAADVDESAAAATAEAAVGGAIAVPADVGDVADIDRMVSTVVAEFGHLDVIVNNAGVTRGAYIMNLTEEDWDRMHRVNAKGVFFCLQRAARRDDPPAARAASSTSPPSRGADSPAPPTPPTPRARARSSVSPGLPPSSSRATTSTSTRSVPGSP